MRLIQGRAYLHCFLVGVNKSYIIIATSDLWLFIHASNLLPSLPTPLPYKQVKKNIKKQKIARWTAADRGRMD